MTPQSLVGVGVSTHDCSNIARHLLRWADESPQRPAVLVPHAARTAEQRLSYAQLNSRSDRYAHALKKEGLEPGERVLILVRPGGDLVAVIYAVFKVGGVAVFVDPGMGLKKLVECVAHIAPQAFIGVSRAQAALALFGRRALKSVRLRLLVGGGIGWGARRLDRLAEERSVPFPLADTQPTDPAAVLFTSGSTGPAKGVEYEHGMFEAQLQQMRKVYGIEPGEVDLPGLPIFSLFSAALGATCVFPDMDPTRPARLDPARFVEYVQKHSVSYSFGSPAIWKPVSQHCMENEIKLPSLRRVLMAGAPVPPLLHERLAEILGGGETFTPYGATEALPVASASGGELASTFETTRAGAGVCVGKPLPSIELRIVSASDGALLSWSDVELLGVGERGEIVVSGDVVTKRYCELPEATQAAKILEEREGETRLWHRMGDLGYLDDQGRLWLCGRVSHRVRTSAGTLYPICCESVFNQHPRVLRSALVGVGEAGAERALVVIQPLPGEFPRGADQEAFSAELRGLGAKQAHTAGITEFLYRKDFPVDLRHNAKIRREVLSAWAAKVAPA